MTTSGKWIAGIGFGLVALAIVFVALALFGLTATLTTLDADVQEETSGTGVDRVALIELEGPITDSHEIIRQLKKYRERSTVKAIVLRLDSPGGAVAPSQEIFDEVRRTKDLGKPVVISMSSVAASGAYYIACGASYIVANPGTITGSIGVISQFLNYRGLMEKVGLESTTIKSGEYKGSGDPTRAMTAKEIAQMQMLIDDVYDQFVTDVADGRKLPVDSVRVLADGRIFTGRQAWRAGLVDTLGTYETAIRVAGMLGKIEGKPKTVREQRRESLFERVMGAKAGRTLEHVSERVSLHTPLEYSLPLGR